MKTIQKVYNQTFFLFSIAMLSVFSGLFISFVSAGVVSCPAGFSQVGETISSTQTSVTCSATIKVCTYKKQFGVQYKQGAKRTTCVPVKADLQKQLTQQKLKTLKHWSSGVTMKIMMTQRAVPAQPLSQFSAPKGDETIPTAAAVPTTPVVGASFAQGFITSHNTERQKVGVPDVVWSDAIATSAQSWATNLQKDGCNLKHSTSDYGENIYWSSNSAGVLPTPQAIVTAWIDEKSQYDYATNTCKKEPCGHYTQVVWKDTTEVGCGYAVCKTKKGVMNMTTSVRVCQYNPAGNIIQQKPY